jgi:hypothetical protein
MWCLALRRNLQHFVFYLLIFFSCSLYRSEWLYSVNIMLMDLI